jgi:hypothetical protein
MKLKIVHRRAFDSSGAGNESQDQEHRSLAWIHRSIDELGETSAGQQAI